MSLKIAERIILQYDSVYYTPLFRYCTVFQVYWNLIRTIYCLLKGNDPIWYSDYSFSKKININNIKSRDYFVIINDDRSILLWIQWLVEHKNGCWLIKINYGRVVPKFCICESLSWQMSSGLHCKNGASWKTARAVQ